MAYGGSTYGSSTYGSEVGASPLITIGKNAKYVVISTPPAKQKSAGYIISTPHLIQKGAQYGVLITKAPLSMYMQYVVAVQRGDQPDYSKGMNAAEYVRIPILLWYNNLVLGGTSSESVPVSSADSVGIYVQVDRATTITLEVQTVNGWVPLVAYGMTYSQTFTGADYLVWNLWMLPFAALRLTTSNEAVITAKVTMVM